MSNIANEFAQYKRNIVNNILNGLRMFGKQLLQYKTGVYGGGGNEIKKKRFTTADVKILSGPESKL